MLIKSRELIFPQREKIIIRSASADDAASLCCHRRLTSQETHFMARYPEECETDPVKMRDAVNHFENNPHDLHVPCIYMKNWAFAAAVSGRMRFC